MKDITLKVDDSLTLNWRAPQAVELEYRGDLTEAGIQARPAPMDVARALPVALEPARAALPRQQGLPVADTARLITDPDTGKYPHASDFRAELLRALKLAGEVWGADVTWESIDEGHWTKLLRRRCEALVAKKCKAVRATEISVSRLITAVSWLRDTKRIARDAAQWPRLWKADVSKHWRGLTGATRDQQPQRARYTIDEFQRILEATTFDPRLYLLLRLAVGLRPGQVARVRRSDLKLPVVDSAASDQADYGTLDVAGAGKKGGAVVDLTRGQRRAVDAALAGEGYLAQAEERYERKGLGDYVLFPTGYIVGRVGMMRGQDTKLSLSDHIDFTKHVSGSWVRKSWRTAEQRAGIEHVAGRCTYGQRRLMVDVAVAEELSPSGIQAAGGWSDTKMPLTVYAEAENRAGRREARPVRARLLGEEE